MPRIARKVDNTFPSNVSIYHRRELESKAPEVFPLPTAFKQASMRKTTANLTYYVYLRNQRVQMYVLHVLTSPIFWFEVCPGQTMKDPHTLKTDILDE